MCGIVGVFDASGPVAAEPRLLPALTALMARRGPDDSGSWSDDRHVALGFHRLSVLDPSPAGSQPMVSPDGRHVLVFNGEVYNFRDLRARLEKQGVRFRSTGDSEAVLWALKTWGVDGLARLDGMFALGFYDRATRTLVMARDPLGIKPLYYQRRGTRLVFGSQYDQVIRHPGCDRAAVDESVLGLYLRFGYVPSPFGLVRGTASLEAGTYLEVTAGREAVIRRYHRWSEGREPLLAGADADEAVAAAVESAVEHQRISDVGIGALLSGGVDSPLVTANLQRSSSSPVKAFTIATTDPELDESAQAARYATALGADHHVRVFSAADALSMVDDVAAAYSEPFADHSAFPTMLVASLAAEHVKVVLSGDGGDEVFWGYPRFAKVLRTSAWFRYPRGLRVAGYAATRWAPVERPARGVLYRSIGEWYRHSHSAITDTELRRLCPDGVRLPGSFDLFELDGRPGDVELARWLRANELRGHLEMVLRKVDRAGMFHGLEVRVPLLHRAVVETALGLHPSTCLADGNGKRPLRRALARLVPGVDVPVRKRGFDVPIGPWLRHELRPLVEDLVLGPDSFTSGHVDAKACRALVDDHTSGRRDRTQAVWNLVALELWARHHLTPLSLVGADAALVGSGPAAPAP